MAEWLEGVRLWIEQMILALGYPGIVLVMLTENLFPPIPSEVVMPFVGFLAARGELNFVGALAAGVVGSLLGAIVLYGLGAWAGEQAARTVVRRYGRWLLLSENDLDQTLGIFARHGTLAVLLGRLMPLVRSLISVPAGIYRMEWRRFLLFTTLGTTLWNLLLMGAGWWLGSRWRELLLLIKQYEQGVWIVVLVIGLGFVLTRLNARRRVSEKPREVSGDPP